MAWKQPSIMYHGEEDNLRGNLWKLLCPLNVSHDDDELQCPSTVNSITVIFPDYKVLREVKLS